MRRLSVGREITLSGEINSCDKLFIEGSVEANLTNCRDVDIAEGGLFKGSASIEDAEVRGRFEGNLVVRKRLLIKATGRVSGTIRYGQIEIECGGQISGDIQAQPAGETGRGYAGRDGRPRRGLISPFSTVARPGAGAAWAGAVSGGSVSGFGAAAAAARAAISSAGPVLAS